MTGRMTQGVDEEASGYLLYYLEHNVLKRIGRFILKYACETALQTGMSFNYIYLTISKTKLYLCVSVYCFMFIMYP